MRAATISAGATARAAAVTSSALIRAVTSAPAATNTSAKVPNASAVSRRGQPGSRRAVAGVAPGPGSRRIGHAEDAGQIGPMDAPGVVPRALSRPSQRRRPDGGFREGGGDEGTRTPDPRDANAVLSQLSYIPTATRRADGGGRPVPKCSTGPPRTPAARYPPADVDRTRLGLDRRALLGLDRRLGRHRRPAARQPPRRGDRPGRRASRWSSSCAIIRGARPAGRSADLAMSVVIGVVAAGAYLSFFTALRIGPLAVVSPVVAAYGGLTVVLAVVVPGRVADAAPGARRGARDGRRRS